MGFATTKPSGSVYASVANGFLRVKTTRGDEYCGLKAAPRELTAGSHKGDTIYEFNFPSFEGKLKDMYFIRDTKNTGYGDQLAFIVEDDTMDKDDRYRRINIQIQLDSRYASKFVQVMGNLNLEEQIKFEPWQMESKQNPGQYIAGWGFSQEGNKVEDYIERKDMPEVTVETVRGKKVFHGQQEMGEFLEQQLEKFMKRNKFGEYNPKRHERDKEHAEEEAKTNKSKGRIPVDDEEEGEDEPPPVKKGGNSSNRKPIPVDDEDEENPY